MKYTLLFLFLCCSANTTNAQEFINEYFTKKKLPINIGYSYDERAYFMAESHVDSTLIQESDTTYWDYEDIIEETAYKKNEDDKLPIEMVRKYLLPNQKLMDNDSINDYLEADFYAINHITNTKNFYLVIYERVYNVVIPSSEKYVCSIDKKGNFISRVLVASLIYSGTYISISGGRMPWMVEVNGNIDENMIITVEDKKYKIKRSGKIVEEK